MKKTIVIIILILNTVNVFSSEKWEWQNPKPNGNVISKVKFLNEQTGFCIGGMGMIMQTKNSGLDWVVHNSNTKTNLNDIFCINENEMFICGDNGLLLKSIDGGAAWQEITSLNSDYNLQSIHFKDSNTGFVIGDSSTIYKTTNGGTDWVKIEIEEKLNLNKIVPVDNNESFAILAASNSILITNDAGKTWSKYLYMQGTLYDLKFINSEIGFAVGIAGSASPGLYFKTKDGGKSWELFNLGTNNTLQCIDFINQNEGFISSNIDLIYSTTDGGENWISHKTNEEYRITSFQYLDRNVSFGISKGNQLIKSKDGGNTWLVLSISEFRNHLTSINMINSTNGWAVGNGIVLKTTNGGEEWVKQSIDTQYDHYLFSDVSFINSQEGWVICSIDDQYNYIFKTTNGGKDWVKSKIRMFNGSKIKFYDSDYGIVFGSYYIGGNHLPQGGINVTWDAGANWTLHYLLGMAAQGYRIDDVVITSKDIAYATGPQKFHKSTDGGKTWYEKGLYSHYYSSLYFLNDNVGWRVGWRIMENKAVNSISRTQDGGENWEYFDDKLKFSPYKIVFLDTLTGFVSGNKGDIAKTEDGGMSWLNFEKLTNQNFNSLKFTNRHSGWAVGDFGTILKYTNDSTGPIYNLPDDKSRLTNKDVLFKWYNMTKAEKYIFQLSLNPNFEELILENTTELNSISILELQEGNTYFWRVKSIKESESLTDWGDTWSFKILDPSNVNSNSISNISSIHPNPATDYINIKTSEVLKTSAGYKIQIFDMLGIEVSSAGGGVYEVDGGGSIRIDISNLPDGVYFIKIGDNVEKFLKM